MNEVYSLVLDLMLAKMTVFVKKGQTSILSYTTDKGYMNSISLDNLMVKSIYTYNKRFKLCFVSMAKFHTSNIYLVENGNKFWKQALN